MKSQNVSMIRAMSVNEILTSVNLIGRTDAITFEAFIIRKLVRQLWKGACVVMDNCPIHLEEEVKKARKKRGKINILITLFTNTPDSLWDRGPNPHSTASTWPHWEGWNPHYAASDWKLSGLLIHQIFHQLKICGQNLKLFSVLSRLLIIKN